MKRFYFLFCFILMLISCTNDSTETEITSNPNLLQRVDLYPGTLSEKRWNFNSDGLLKEITKADGTVVENFTYDSQNRLINSTSFSDVGFNETHIFTYDTNGFVITVDGENINYDSTLNAYYTGSLNGTYRFTKLNSDKLLIDGRTVVVEIEDGIPYESQWFQMSVIYSNNNVVSYFPNYENCNYLTYDTKVNPLKIGTLAIARAFSFVASTSWTHAEGIFSTNNVLTHRYCLEDPESSVYNYTYNSNNLPIEQTHDSYYLGTFENTNISAKYYYQGDVLP